MKIKPKLRRTKNTAKFSDFNEGDCFLLDDDIWMKIQDGVDMEQRCVSLTDGEVLIEMCDTSVVPVDAELNWKRKNN